MNQDQQPQPSQPWWKDNWIVLALVALVVVITTIAILGYWLRLSWTGFVVIEDKDPASPMRVEVVTDPKLFWDWLELLIIPVVLGAGALWFNQWARKGDQEQRKNELEIANQQRQNELEIADQQRKEDSLQRYLDTMQELILDKDKGLRRSEKDAEIRSVARARTLTVLRSLDNNRKGHVVRFLHEADLIGKAVREELGERRVIDAIINLRAADLTGASLSAANLSNADLTGANLSSANLSSANLRDANLTGAALNHADLNSSNLTGANLRFPTLWLADLRFPTLWHANLSGANLTGADLSGANLWNTNLWDTNLSGANLSGADLSGAILRGAILWGTHLEGARNCTNEQLAQAESLVRATLPNGRVIETEEAWEEFKKQYRQPSQAG